jgi:hypothetical protein
MRTCFREADAYNSYLLWGRKMKYIASSIVLMFIAGASAVSFAGGVGSGGGGTRTKLATPDQVADTVRNYAGTIAQGWFQFKEKDTKDGVDHGAFEALTKIFASTTDIYQVLHATKIELRMNAACQDADGAPVDGSIYASQPGAICISPFTMAPKLNQENYQVETIALVMHEASHLLGLNEDEAVQLQDEIVKELKDVNFAEAAQSMQDLGSNDPKSALGKILKLLKKGIQDPGALKAEKITRMEENLLNLGYAGVQQQLQFTPAKSMALMDPNFVNTSMIADFVCYNDSSLDKDERDKCQADFDEGFGADHQLTARIYLARQRNVDPAKYNAEYDEVVLDRPAGIGDLPAALTKMQQYVQDMQAQIQQLYAFKIQTYVN